MLSERASLQGGGLPGGPAARPSTSRGGALGSSRRRGAAGGGRGPPFIVVLISLALLLLLVFVVLIFCLLARPAARAAAVAVALTLAGIPGNMQRASRRVRDNPPERRVDPGCGLLGGAAAKLVDEVLLEEALHRADVPVVERHAAHSALLRPSLPPLLPAPGPELPEADLEAPAGAQGHRDDAGVRLQAAEELLIVRVPADAVALVLVEIEVHRVWQILIGELEARQPTSHHRLHPPREGHGVHQLLAVLVRAATAVLHHPRGLARDALLARGARAEVVPAHSLDERVEVVLPDALISAPQSHP
mmetsp:Transcript_42140/g.120533  ORF Transcript_42140/g.120533 Transcript_42140/m.120533 type:complete len:305 (+) Transcript_42140:58-972(+)